MVLLDADASLWSTPVSQSVSQSVSIGLELTGKVEQPLDSGTKVRTQRSHFFRYPVPYLS